MITTIDIESNSNLPDVINSMENIITSIENNNQSGNIAISPDNNLPKKKLSKKQLEVDNLFKPNENGVSVWITKQEISANKLLDWGKNGAARHGVYFGDKRYLWEKQGDRSITALRTIGFSDDYLYGASRPIRKDIHEYHKKTGCVVCGSHSDLVTDHKNDLYNDLRVLDSKTQTIDDFQCLCNHCNLQKRQVSKVTTENGKRIGATTIPQLAIFGVDFVEGDSTFDPSDINAMVGTYWYDPVEFIKKLKKKLL